MSKAYFLQDTRTYVGNSMVFWREGGGYTTKIAEAQLFSEEEAMAQHKDRETDKPWPYEKIAAAATYQVDIQDLR